MVKMLQKKNIFPSGNKPGFSLLEIVIVIALIGLLFAVGLPNLMGRKKLNERNEFFSELNTVMSEIWLRGLEKNVIHQVTFDLEHRKFVVKEKTENLDADKKPVFAPIPLYFAHAQYQWPESFEIQQLFVQNKDELATGGISRTTENVWFYIMPGGASQEVIVNIVDQESDSDLEGKPFSIVLNPFTVQCEMYDHFQKPTA